MSNYIERFRNKMTSESAVSSQLSDIIALSTSRIELVIERLAKAIPAIFINGDKETGDDAIMYSYYDDGVVVGDYAILSNNDTYLIYQKIRNVQREGFIDSFRAIACNISFSYNNAAVKGYFRGPLRGISSDEVNLTGRLGVDSKQEAFIMMPSAITIKKNITIQIQNQGFRVVAVDDLTNPGITYLGLEEDILIQTDKVSIVVDQDYVETIPDTLLTGVEYNFATEEGYIEASKVINIIERTSTNIKIVIPFGTTTSIIIKTKALGAVVTKTYTIGG